MGLRLNHMSGSGNLAVTKSVGSDLSVIAVTGAMYMGPHDEFGVAQTTWSSNPDAAYIWDNAGVGEKALFLGDVVVSGSLKLGAGGNFLDGSGAAEKVAIFSDGETITTDGLAYDISADQLTVGAEAANGAIRLGSGSAGNVGPFFHNKGAESNSVSGILHDHASKFGISASNASSGIIEIGGAFMARMGSDRSVALGVGSTSHFLVQTGSGGGNNAITFNAMHSMDNGSGLRTSDVTVQGQVLTLTSSEGVFINGGDASASNTVNIGVDAGGYNINLGTVGSKVLKVGNAGAVVQLTGSAGRMEVLASGQTLDVDAATVDIEATSAISLDAAGASNFTTSAGALTLVGAAGESVGTANQTTALAGNLTVAQDATITGNLTVNGSTTTVDTTNLLVEDPFALLGANAASANANAGILFVSGSTVGASRPDVVFGRKANDKWGLGSIASLKGTITDATSMTHDIQLQAAGFEGALTGSVLNSDLTAQRVVLAGTGGLLEDSANLTFDGTTLVANSALTVGASGAGAVAIDGTTLSLDGTAATNLTMTANAGSAVALTIASSNTGAGTGTIDMDADGVIEIDAGGAITIESSASTIKLGADDVDQNITIGEDGVRTIKVGTLSGAGSGAASTEVDIAAAKLDLDGGVNGVTIDSAKASGDAILLTAGNASGGVQMVVNAATILSLDANSIDISQSLLPTADNSIDLGGSSNRFANIYTGDLNLRNDRGDWTLIEEEDFISFRNNKTGRRFRMVMEDITGLGIYGPGNDGEM